MILISSYCIRIYIDSRGRGRSWRRTGYCIVLMLVMFIINICV